MGHPWEVPVCCLSISAEKKPLSCHCPRRDGRDGVLDLAEESEACMVALAVAYMVGQAAVYTVAETLGILKHQALEMLETWKHQSPE
jgi:hypothetical protein